MKLMTQNLNKIIFTLALAIAVFLFFTIFYSSHLHYQEQFQLFLFDALYWQERISIPGGLADYLGEFITQFYYNSWIGAALISILLVAVQQLIWFISKGFKRADSFYPLTLLPSIAIWAFLCDENAMLSFVIAIIISLVFTLFYSKINLNIIRISYGVLLLPLLYWCIGSAFYIAVILIVFHEWFITAKSKKVFLALLLTIVLVAISIACPLLAQKWIQYPLANLFTGINYYRFPAVLPYTVLVIFFLAIFIPPLFIILPAKLKKHGNIVIIAQMISLIGIAYLSISFTTNSAKEEALEYDYLVRTQKWSEVIKKAEKKSPTSPFSVTCLNLALAKTNQLGDRMFTFYQNGVEGLLPVFQRDFTSPLPTSEAYYHLGMINTAQRYTFEAMEAIPNFRKSARAYKRLAETNLINGQYEVAAKYLYALSQTLFYKKWAEETLTYLYNEEKINKHPEWGKLRRLRYQEDFLFSPTEQDIMLGLLVQHNKENKMAFEYMLAHTLLSKNIDSFMRYYPLGKDLSYNHIPRSYQELLVFVWTQQNKSFDGMPWSISESVKQSVTDFARIYIKQPDAETILKQRFGNTYWSYLLFEAKN